MVADGRHTIAHSLRLSSFNVNLTGRLNWTTLVRSGSRSGSHYKPHGHWMPRYSKDSGAFSFAVVATLLLPSALTSFDNRRRVRPERLGRSASTSTTYQLQTPSFASYQ